MHPRDEYDVGMGFIRTMLGMCSIVVVLAASKTYTTIKESQAKENPNKIENENEMDEYTVLNYNDNALVVKSVALKDSDTEKNFVVFTDLEGNTSVAAKNDVNVLGTFPTYDEAIQYINNNQLSQDVEQQSHVK